MLECPRCQGRKWAGDPFLTLNFANPGAAPVLLCIEPWAHVYEIPPGETWQLDLMGVPAIEGPTIDVRPDLITVWPPCGLRLRHGDRSTPRRGERKEYERSYPIRARSYFLRALVNGTLAAPGPDQAALRREIAQQP